MAYRATRKQRENLTSTNNQSSSPTRTRVSTSPHSTTISPTPRTIKQELSRRHTPHQTSKGTREYHLSSNPHHQIDTDQGRRASHYSDSHHRYLSAYQEPGTRDTTPSLDGMKGLHLIGMNPQILIDSLSQLGNYDVEHVVDLPKIIVIGDQSAGKSSLIGRLSEMSLPTNSGCCTRCPANIITKPADTWSCTISLRQKFGYRKPKNPIKDKEATKNNPFPPWFEQELVTKEFIRITEKSKLENAMKWAQIALLNHNQDYDQFIPGKGGHFLNNNTTTEAEVTPNVVKVEISGPNLPTLSFFDLPGIIANTPNADQRYLIKVFENIAKKYIRTPNTLIIFVMTMSVEAVLSKAKSLIEEEHATDRCMGVLTKPDTLVEKDGTGGTSDWEKILNEEEHRLGHGWRVTRQPGPDFRSNGLDYHVQACKNEKSFFDNNALWQGTWSKYQDKCGIPRIQRLLSELLAESIRKSLPDIKKKVHKRKAAIKSELDGLPELPNQNVQLHVSRLLHNFSQEVKRMMNSEQNTSDITFHGSWTKLSRQFHELILHNKPRITVSDPSDVLFFEQIDLDNDDGEAKLVPVPHGIRKRSYDQMASEGTSNTSDEPPSTTSVLKSETPTRQNSRLFAHAHQKPFKNTIFEHHSHYGRGFTTIGEIRRQIENYTYMGLPDMVNTPVYKHFCQNAVRNWKAPVQQLLHGVIGLLRTEIEKCVDRILGPFRQTGLYRKSIVHIREWIEELLKQQSEALDEIYELETYNPFTMNQEDIQKIKRAEKAELQKVRHRVRAIRFVEKELHIKPAKLKTKEIEGEKATLQETMRLVDLVKPEQLDKDPFQNEIDVAAYIRGYYFVAGKRFIDSVCISINNRLFRQVTEKIDNLLDFRLGVSDPNTGAKTCGELMEENTEVGAKRRKLKTELEELKAFEIEFEKLVREQVQARVEDDIESSATAAIDEEPRRSESRDSEPAGIRYQSPVSDLLQRRNRYNNTNEMREAEKRGEYYVNEMPDISEA
ncbi:uncharacterized protein EAE97_009912 [Botrytis byssoidea]|uniref:GED domain-containing protein n=1 Tax=Botrytis byssoidea TaxID=139641 RepID=A0A9P5I0E0_9HELO|nr:uncharacterized protein EAE97_009912 [Botrytis byssoidea]KAF7928114.1 hypothetical protein EAE97_009912 [Botrytis byssoidea]